METKEFINNVYWKIDMGFSQTMGERSLRSGRQTISIHLCCARKMLFRLSLPCWGVFAWLPETGRDCIWYQPLPKKRWQGVKERKMGISRHTSGHVLQVPTEDAKGQGVFMSGQSRWKD
jgi:hypothetical protein